VHRFFLLAPGLDGSTCGVIIHQCFTGMLEQNFMLDAFPGATQVSHRKTVECRSVFGGDLCVNYWSAAHDIFYYKFCRNLVLRLSSNFAGTAKLTNSRISFVTVLILLPV